MRKLLQFIIKHIPFLVFVLFFVLSVILLVKNNPFQRSVYFTSANNMVGTIYSTSSNINGYFGLREINQGLLERNGKLEQELQYLKEQLKDSEYELLTTKNKIYTTAQKKQANAKPVNAKQEVKKTQVNLIDTLTVTKDTVNFVKPPEVWETKYEFLMAQVINNNISHYENYITLNKGALDGVKPLMGVADHNGIIGIVSVVGPKYSVAISILNTKLRLSAKVKNSEFFGSLVWKGDNPNYAILEELPLHVNFNIGDTIVTSGYSAAFPPGLMVGTVEGLADNKNDNFHALRVKLAAEFARLTDVQIIINNEQEEQLMLEKEVKK